jgi:hypothetical protein
MPNLDSFGKPIRDGAHYLDRHGDTWRAVLDATEFRLVQKADNSVRPGDAHPWYEDTASVIRSDGPMVPTGRPSYGPDHLRVNATTTGAEIDTETHDRHTIETVLGLILGEYADDFEAVADLQPTHDGHAPERLPYERLVEQLVTRLPRTAPLYGAEVARMADELHTIARPKGLPQQRKGGEAA